MNEMKEIWKDIEGYEGLYQVSTKGRVMKLAREFYRSNGCIIRYKQRILQLQKRKDGYIGVSLLRMYKKQSFLVHRLVAKAFIPNPDNLKYINHKNEIKTDNCVENLEWCTSSYNNSYGTHTKKIEEKRRIHNFTHKSPVVQMTLDGKEIARYDSVYFASKETLVDQSSIYKVCAGKPHFLSAGGYRWAFVNIDSKE